MGRTRAAGGRLAIIGWWAPSDDRLNSPVLAELPRLTDTKRALYSDLVEDRFGHNVRLEQERIRFGAVRRTIHDVVGAPMDDRAGGAEVNLGVGGRA